MKGNNIIEIDNYKLNKSNDQELKKENSSFPQKVDLQIKNNKNKNESENDGLMIFWYIFLSFIMLFALVYFFFFIAFVKKTSNTLASEYDIYKSHVDDRKYRAIRLQNGIEALLISDQNNFKNAISLTVGAGSFQDDEELPGLAHILEHSILLGSNDFPRPSYFEDLLAKNFGFLNSFTEDEKTTFYFEMDYLGFEDGMKVFSRLFGNPKLDANLIPLHLLKIEEELKRNMNKDQLREIQIIKNFANPAHPFSRFSLGDLEKLKKRNVGFIHSMMKTFYNKFYTPNNMKLVVLSNLNIEILEEKVTKIFSKIREEEAAEGLSKPRYGEIPNRSEAFTDKELNQIIWYKRDSHSLPPVLDFVFILDEINSKNSVKPLEYISYLLKYKGKNSLLHNLKKHNFASNIDSGVIASYKHFSQFAISVTLTNKGVKEFKSVIEEVFLFIEFMKNNSKVSINNTIYKDLSNIFSNNFNFWQKNEKLKLSEYMNNLSINMFDYPYKNFVSHDNIMQNFNETIISEYLNNLTPLNSLVIIGTNKMNSNLLKFFGEKNKVLKDKYFGTEYTHVKMPKEFHSKLNEKVDNSQHTFELRRENKYITKLKDLEMCVESPKDYNMQSGFIKLNKEKEYDCEKEKNKLAPKLIYNKNKISLWFKLDRTFLSPKANLHINIPAELVLKSIEDSVDVNIYFAYVKELLIIKLSEAIDAGNQIEITINENGLNLFITAYSDVIRKISEKVFSILFSNEYVKKYLTKDIYKNHLEKIYQRFAGQVEHSAEKRIFEIFKKIGKRKFFTNFDKINYMKKNITLIKENFSKFVSKITAMQKDLFFIGMLYGNVKDHDLNIIIENLEKYFPEDNKILKIGNSKNKKKLKSKTSKRSLSEKNSGEKLMHLLHNHYLIDGSFVYRSLLTNNTHLNYNKNLIGNFYQVGKRDYMQNLMMTLTEMIWGNLFKLNINKKDKNKHSLGNYVSGRKKIIDNIMYYVFIVESNKETSPNMINAELDKILNKLFERLDSLDSNKLDRYKEMIKSELLNEDSNLDERSSRAWNEIFENSLQFDYKEHLTQEIEKITVKDLIEFFKTVFISQPRKLSIQLYTNTKEYTLKTKSEEEIYGTLNNKVKSIVKKDFLIFQNSRMISK